MPVVAVVVMMVVAQNPNVLEFGLHAYANSQTCRSSAKSLDPSASPPSTSRNKPAECVPTVHPTPRSEQV